jgi:hypothetical protein
MESVHKITVFGLKMMVKTGLEKKKFEVPLLTYVEAIFF